MSIFDYILVCLVAASALALILVIASLFGSSALRAFRGSRDAMLLKKFQKRLEKIDEFITQKKYPNAVEELRAAFWLAPVPSLKLVAAIRDHNQNVLSRCLVVAEEHEVRVDNIAVLEQLLFERSELYRLSIKSEGSFDRLQERREKSGKKIPTWSKSDFDRRLGEIRSQLQENEKMIAREIDKLCLLLQSPGGEGITYH